MATPIKPARFASWPATKSQAKTTTYVPAIARTRRAGLAAVFRMVASPCAAGGPRSFSRLLGNPLATRHKAKRQPTQYGGLMGADAVGVDMGDHGGAGLDRDGARRGKVSMEIPESRSKNTRSSPVPPSLLCWVRCNRPARI